MTPFNLQRFLGETGISLHRLATFLQVAESYLEAAVAGRGRLTRRDEDACRKLRRRLTRWKQLDLPFAESARTFSRDHARATARAEAKSTAARTGRRRTPPPPEDSGAADPPIAPRLL